MFEWKPIFSVGIREMDAEHQKLFQVAEEFYLAIVGGKGKATVEKTLDGLVKFTKVHFAHEERIMRDCGYPQYAEHKAQHDAMAGQVSRFQAELTSGQSVMTVQLMRFLKLWLEHHIQGEDKKYAPVVAAARAEGAERPVPANSQPS